MRREIKVQGAHEELQEIEAVEVESASSAHRAVLADRASALQDHARASMNAVNHEHRGDTWSGRVVPRDPASLVKGADTHGWLGHGTLGRQRFNVMVMTLLVVASMVLGSWSLALLVAWKRGTHICMMPKLSNYEQAGLPNMTSLGASSQPEAQSAIDAAADAAATAVLDQATATGEESSDSDCDFEVGL